MIGGKWLYNDFVGTDPRIYSKKDTAFLCCSYQAFFFNRFVRGLGVQPYTITDMTIVWKIFRFILSEISDFYIIDNPSIAVHAFSTRTLTSLSKNEILLPMYMNWFTVFWGLPLKKEIVPSYLIHVNSFLSAFTWRQIPLAVCSRLWTMDLAWECVFAKSARSSA